MNKTFLIGRLTSEPELRYTNQNKAYCRFSIAVNRLKNLEGIQEVDFIKCSVWNKQAENLCKYQSKGNQIAIEGSIRTEKYQNKEGNDITTTYVLVNNIQFLDNKSENKSEVKKEENLSNDTDPFTEFGNKISIDNDFLD